MSKPVTLTGHFRTENNTLKTKTVTIYPSPDASEQFCELFTSVCDTNGLRENNYGKDWALWEDTGEEFKTIESLVWGFPGLIHSDPDTDLASLETATLLHFIDEETGGEYSLSPNYF